MKKVILTGTVLMFICVSFLHYGCKKKSSDEPAAISCSDGIQNQGETGVDCGGPCAKCPTNICTGNGSAEYLPLANGNYWRYEDPNPNDYNEYTVTGTKVISSKTYWKIKYQDIFGVDSIFLRKATNGDIFQYDYTSSAEYLYVPASPTLNQTWSIPGGDTRKVISLSYAVSTSGCGYTGCLQMQDFLGGTTAAGKHAYKKGVGLVQIYYFSPLNLDAITLY